jgi:hypothetical protein
VDTLVSQYAAFLGGRIHEVASDSYAQADDGSVWYFGEYVARINTQLEELLSAVGDEDLAAASDAATRLREMLAGMAPAS